MSTPNIIPLLERQLLLQLGDRLRRLRKAQGLGTVEMAARAGVSRNTLRAVEAGDPAPSIGTYLRIMSVLGVGADVALLASDTLLPAPSDSAAARSRRAAPVVQVRVSADEAGHRLQDLQSLALHEEAVRMAKAAPALVQQAQDTALRWLGTGDVRSAALWREWLDICGRVPGARCSAAATCAAIAPDFAAGHHSCAAGAPAHPAGSGRIEKRGGIGRGAGGLGQWRKC